MDPDDFRDGAYEGDFALKGEMGVRHEGFDEDILNEAETGAEMDEFDVERVHPHLTAVHQSGKH